jgi:hypothetical protein
LSSILKALKKIEGDSPPPQTHLSMPKSMASKQGHKSNSSRRWRKLLYLFLLLLVMAAVTVMAFSQRRLIIAKMMSIMSSESPTAGPAADSSPTRIYRAKVPSPSAKPAPKPPVVKRQTKTQTKKVVSGTRDKKFQARTQSGKQRLISGTSPPQPASGTRKPNTSRNSRVKKPLKKDTPPPGSAPAKAPAKKTTAAKDTRPTAPAARANQSAKTRSRKTYDRIADSKLKLQALAWSDDSVRRMAVINGRIVHEGDSVDGYQVVEIRTEEVIVKAGGKSWRLEFGLRQ